MTNFEAFDKLEAQALSLGLIDPETKERIEEAMIVLGIISKHFGDEWEVIAKALASGEIVADEYHSKMSDMIQRYADETLTNRIDQELLDLYNNQGEFPLTRQGVLI